MAPCAVLFADKMWNGDTLSYTDEYKAALTKSVLGAKTPDGFELFEKYFGSVIPPRTKELAYYDNVFISKEGIDKALQILGGITENFYVASYKDALEQMKNNL